MRKKKLLIALLIPVALLAAAMGLWSLGRSILYAHIAPEPEATAPGRLVSRIDAAAYPVDPETSRCYTSQSDVTQMLRLLRALSSGEAAGDVPALEDAAWFLSITLTYANGGRSTCYLVEDRFVQFGDEAWYLAEPESVVLLSEFLDSHPGGSSEPTDPVAEPNAPAAETTAPSI